jgi:opacity protein-like surface antigen
MKKIVLSLGAIIAMSSLGFAGGNVMPVVVPVVVDEPTEDEGLYLGLAYTHLSHDADHRGATIVSEMDFSAVTLQAGYKFNPYIAVEGRYGFTLGDSSDSGLTIDDAEIGVWGIYIKPMYPVSPEFDIYALLGYAGTKAEDRNNVLEVDESGFSWGVGAAYSVTEEFSVFADYVVFYDDSSVRYDHVIDGFNFGVSYQF